jgi:hypothetical protein
MRSKKEGILDLIIFIFVGPFMMLISQITDAYHFWTHLYEEKIQKLQETPKGQTFSLQEFAEFEKTLYKIILELRSEHKIIDSLVSSKILCLKFRSAYKVDECIRALMFEAHRDDLQMTFHHISLYNLVKKVIIKSSDADKMINLRVFSGLIKELRLKIDYTMHGLGSQ